MMRVALLRKSLSGTAYMRVSGIVYSGLYNTRARHITAIHRIPL